MTNRLLLQDVEQGHMVVEIEGKARTLAAMIASAMDDSEELAQVFKMAVLAYIADKVGVNIDKGEENFLAEMYKKDKSNSKLN